MIYKAFQSKSIKFKVTLASLSIFLVSVWSLAFYAGRLLREDMEHLAGEQQFSTVSFMAAEINDALETRLKSLEKVASQITPPMLDHPASLQALLEQRPLLQILFNGGVFATGIDGIAIADVPPSAGRIGVNYLDRDAIFRTLKEGTSIVGRPAMGKKLAAPLFSLGVPIRDARGKAIGVLAGTINLNLPSFLDKLTGNRYGKTGGYLLVAPQYRLVVTATDKRRVMTPASPPGSNKLIDRFMQGYEGTGITVNSLGVEVLASVKRIPAAGWYVAVSLPTAEAFAPLRTMRHRLLLAEVLITLIACGLTWWILRHLLSPMLATIATISAMTETGQPPQPLPIVRNDEIGQLIGGFNRLLKTLALREENLFQAKKKLRSILQSALDGFYILDHEGRFLEANGAYCTMSGYTEQELSAMRITDVEAIETADETAFRMRKIIVQGKEHFETRHRRKDGSVFEVEVSVMHQLIDGGRFTVFVHDITERKKAEDALRESETRFSTVFHNSPIAIGISPMDNGPFIDVNDAFLAIFGYTRDEVIGRTSIDLGLWPFPEERKEMIRLLHNHALVQQYEARFRHKSGRIGYLIISAEIIELSGQHYIMGMLSDITKHKQAEEALKNSEERYHQLFEMESDTILMVDWENSRFLDANSAASRMYGYSREEFLQLTPADLSVEPIDTEKSLHNEEASVIIRRHRKKDGTEFPVEINRSFFVYQGRKVHVAAIRDIAERVQAERHLLDLNQRLRALSGHLQSVQEQERLAISRDMHDDVGQILTALKLDLRWLEQNLAPSEKAIPLRLKEMRMNVDQITTVVQRIAANLRPPLLDNLGLPAAIEWHAGEFGKRSGIECFVMINEDTDTIDKETATAIMRILQEGLTNIARHARATEVGISLCIRDGSLILEITDNGCGISPEQVASQDAYGLMGMQERAKLCNGNLEIKGEPGIGTILLLTIPLEIGEQDI